MELLRLESGKLGIELNGRAGQLLQSYMQLLQSWNGRINLVRFVSLEELCLRHIIDSLACTLGMEMNDDLRVIDLGSGAGLPGIPIKIVCPQLRMTLLESQQRRCLFLNEVNRELQLQLEVVNGRAEEIGRLPGYREQFDYVVARAVSSLATLAELSLPLLKNGGRLVAMKGQRVGEEIGEAEYALEVLGGEMKAVIEYNIEDETGRLAVIGKKGDIPEKYPRRPGMPGKRPLTRGR
jgi:16S rRNA (guanine527-N7)-methyltransferase